MPLHPERQSIALPLRIFFGGMPARLPRLPHQYKDPAHKHRVVIGRSYNAGCLRRRLELKPLASSYRGKNHGGMHAHHAGGDHKTQNQSLTEICKHFCSLRCM